MHQTPYIFLHIIHLILPFSFSIPFYFCRPGWSRGEGRGLHLEQRIICIWGGNCNAASSDDHPTHPASKLLCCKLYASDLCLTKDITGRFCNSVTLVFRLWDTKLLLQSTLHNCLLLNCLQDLGKDEKAGQFWHSEEEGLLLLSKLDSKCPKGQADPSLSKCSILI